MDEVKFGTSGLRGRVESLTSKLCWTYATAFLRLMQEKSFLDRKQGLFLGMDLRPTSPSLACAVAAAARYVGLEVENCGALPTPALALAACEHGLPAIMITGSHIPADRNGLKFYSPRGEIDKQDEQAICQKLERFALVPVESFSSPLPPASKRALAYYKTRALGILPQGTLHGMRIGIYQQSSVVRDLLGEVLAELGAQIVPFGRSESFLAIDTEALDKETRNIALEAAQAYKLDAIVSTDGDGDRPLIAGSDGVYLRGDHIGLLCAQFLAADCVVTPVTSSAVVERSGLFAQVYRCRVGSPYVLAEMARAKAQNFQRIVGFEANGGVLLGCDIDLEQGSLLPALPTRDALLPILAVLGLAARQLIPIEKLTSALPSCFTASDRLENIATKRAIDFLARLGSHSQLRRDFCYNFGTIESQDELDGLRLLLTKGESLHYRASGNAPELRCYSEASTLDKAESLLQKGLAFARLHV